MFTCAHHKYILPKWSVAQLVLYYRTVYQLNSLTCTCTCMPTFDVFWNPEEVFIFRRSRGDLPPNKADSDNYPIYCSHSNFHTHPRGRHHWIIAGELAHRMCIHLLCLESNWKRNFSFVCKCLFTLNKRHFYWLHNAHTFITQFPLLINDTLSWSVFEYLMLAERYLPLEALFVDILMLSSYYICIVMTSHYTLMHTFAANIRFIVLCQWYCGDLWCVANQIISSILSVSVRFFPTMCQKLKKKNVSRLYAVQCPIKRTFAPRN